MEKTNRKKENLKDFIDKKDSDVAIIYGRSGMGKTTYLENLLSMYDGFYFSAYSTTSEMELNLLYKEFLLSKNFNFKINVRSKNLTLKGILEEITDYAKDKKQPYLVIIDNFVEFVKADDEFNKILKKFVLNEWKDANLRLFLCSDSFIGMDNYVLSKKSIWRNVKKCTVLFDSLPFSEAVKKLNCKTDMDYILEYGITGGIPELMDASYDNYAISEKKESLLENCFPTDKYRKSNPEYAMRNDLREFAYYNRLMSILAEGVQRVNEISEIFGKPKDVVVPYLKTLIKLDLVKKETPVTEKLNRRKTRYSIKNSSDIFWYKFIVSELSYIETKNKYPELDEEELLKFEKRVFIDICKEYLIKKSGQGEFNFELKDIGNWWKNDEENHTTEGFDIVGLGKNDIEEATVFSRCFCSKNPVQMQELKDLINLTKNVKRRGENYYVFFSVSGFNENALTAASAIKNIILVDLDKIISDYKK